jgi:peptidoglycan hydrolase CwlO-like protein
MDKIFMQGVNARLSENEKYRKEAAEIVIDTEKKIDEIEKEMAEKKREYEIEKAKAVANGSNEQLRELEYRYKEEIAGLETQKAEAEDILYTAHLHEKEFIEEIEELRKRNSMNELARLMYDHNKKIVTITEETQKEIDAVKEKIQAAIEEGVAKREEMKKTTDTNIALMKETTTAHKAELDTQLNNLKTHVAQSNAVIETLKSSPANLLTGFSSRAPSIFQPPWMAEGGIVTKPTLAMVGESGPEAVVPLNKTLGNINITITGNTFMSDDEAAVRIGDMIINELKLGNRV